jgi:PTS system cellobiose-specific IIA component
MNETELKYDFPTISMNIIMPAGDARTKIEEAFSAALNGNFDEAYKLLDEGNQFIKTAHKAQTDILQSLALDEFNGNNQTILPMLFIHAQDTIMTIMSEYNMTKQNIAILKKVEEVKEWKK